MRNREEPKVRIKPGEKLGLDLSAAERETVLNHLVCLDIELEEAVRTTADDAPVKLTLDELEDLHGHCAAEANHTSDKKLKKALGGVLRKIESLLDRFTDDQNAPATPAPDLAQWVSFTLNIARQTKVDPSGLHAEIVFSPEERIVLLNLIENEYIRQKLGLAAPSEALWLNCEELCQILTELSSPLKSGSGGSENVPSSLAAKLVQQVTEMLSMSFKNSRSPISRTKGTRIHPGSYKIAVRLTLAQRVAVAELKPNLTERLRLNEKNERSFDFSIEEATAIKAAAGEAIHDAPTGMKRNSLRHIMDKLSAALDQLAAVGRVYQFKITLKDCQPPIWRRIQVTDGTLDQLHEHIQLAMGWTNSHLHDFKINGRLYGDPLLLEDNFEEMHYQDSTTTQVSDILPKNGQRFLFEYQYDFGDSWDHEVLFEGWMEDKSDLKHPLCLEGERACPPEDVGGTGGYEEFLAAVADPAHEQHQDYLKWCGGKFDPAKFTAAEATKAMKKGLPNWREMEEDAF